MLLNLFRPPGPGNKGPTHIWVSRLCFGLGPPKHVVSLLVSPLKPATKRGYQQQKKATHFGDRDNAKASLVELALARLFMTRFQKEGILSPKSPIHPEQVPRNRKASAPKGASWLVHLRFPACKLGPAMRRTPFSWIFKGKPHK